MGKCLASRSTAPHWQRLTVSKYRIVRRYRTGNTARRHAPDMIESGILWRRTPLYAAPFVINAT